MKKMRKALLALLLSITVAGTSAAPVMAAGTHIQKNYQSSINSNLKVLSSYGNSEA